MKRHVFLILCGLLAGLMIAPVLAQEPVLECRQLPGPESYDKYIRLGDEARDLGSYPEAVNQYSCAIVTDPENPIGFSRRGKIYLDHLERYQDAILDYGEVTQLDPNDAVAYNNRGWAYIKLRQFQTAVTNFNLSLKIDPNYALAYNNRGVAFNYLLSPDQAIADFERAFELDFEPKSWLYNNIGIAYTIHGQLTLAVENLEQAIALDPDFAQAYYYLGNVYYSLQRYPESLENYNRYVQLVGEENADYPALETIASLSGSNEFVRLLPLLFIGGIVLLVIISSLWPLIRGRRSPAKKRGDVDIPAYQGDENGYPIDGPYPDEGLVYGADAEYDAADMLEKPKRQPSPRIRPTAIVTGLITVTVGAILFVLRQGNRNR